MQDQQLLRETSCVCVLIQGIVFEQVFTLQTCFNIQAFACSFSNPAPSAAGAESDKEVEAMDPHCLVSGSEYEDSQLTPKF